MEFRLHPSQKALKDLLKNNFINQHYRTVCVFILYLESMCIYEILIEKDFWKLFSLIRYYHMQEGGWKFMLFKKNKEKRNI